MNCVHGAFEDDGMHDHRIESGVDLNAPPHPPDERTAQSDCVGV
jgi:hypothetical protein